MKDLTNLINKKNAGKLAGVMQVLCVVYIILLIMASCLVCMGRLQFELSTTTGKDYPNAIYAEEVHSEEGLAEGFSIFSTDDKFYIRTSSPKERISLPTHICLVFMYLLGTIPIIYTGILLFNVLENIKKGEIFTKNNAHYLMYYAIIRIAVAVIYPFAKLLFVGVVNNFLVYDNISLFTGQNMINSIMPNIGFLLAVYILNDGVNLQDEVDNTL